MKIYILFLSAILLGLSHGYFEGRSGDIIINDQQQPQAQLSWTVDVKKMKDIQLYDMFARLFGTPRYTSTEPLNVAVDLFDRPQGNLLFSVEGLTSNRLTKSDFRIFSPSSIIDLQPSSEPHTPYSVLGSVLTGVDAKTHGSVNQKWPSLRIGDDSRYFVGNFFDSLTQLYPGKSFLCGSSSRDALAGLSPHEEFEVRANEFYWDQKSYVSNKQDESSLGISLTQFPALIKKLGTVLGWRVVYSPTDSLVTIMKDDKKTVVFDISDKEDETLFAEVLFVLNVASHSEVDFFSFHFRALADIYAKYGVSDEFDMAVYLVDAAIAHVVDVFSHLDRRITYEILYFPDQYRTQNVEETVLSVVRDYVLVPSGLSSISHFLDYFPHIYLNKIGHTRDVQLCSELKTALANAPVDVYCTPLPTTKRAFQQTPTPAPTPTPTPESGGATQQQISLLHIVMWSLIFFTIALLMSCYYMAGIDGSGEPEFRPRSFERLTSQSIVQRVQ